MTTNKEIGARVRAYREVSGLSQERLAAAIGVHQTGIAAIENYGRALPILRAATLADALGITVMDLLSDTSATPDARALRIDALIREVEGLRRDLIEATR